MEYESALGWLMAAGAAVWLGIGCYACLLAAKQRGIAIRLRQLERLCHDEK